MYSRILVPLDGSSTAQRGLEHAVRLAGALGATLRLLHVVDARQLLAEGSAGALPESRLEAWRIAGEQFVASVARQVRNAGVEVEGVVRYDPGLRVSDLIVREATDGQADLIVMGTHGRRGLRRLALGSDAELVLRESPVPIVLVRAESGDSDT
jgi:nucleotide-binding universal stress UspA family protein